MRLSAATTKIAGAISGLTAALACPRKPWVYRFVFKQWPQLRERIPADLEYIRRDRLDILASSAEWPIWNWTYSGGGSLFLRDELPDPFYACISQNRGNFDQLIVMWRIGGRRFWFNNTWSILIGGPKASLILETGERLDHALSEWDETEKSVVFSGDLGWLDVDSFQWLIRGRRVEAAKVEKAEEHMRRHVELGWKQ